MADSNADLLADWKDFDGRYHALQAQIAQQSAQVELVEVYKLAVQLCELIETFVTRWRSSIIVPDLLQEIDARRSFALQIKGSTGTVTGHWPEAREALETVVKDFTGERRAVAALGLGTGLLNRGQYNEAIPHLLTAIEEAGDLRIPTKIYAWSQLATCHFNLDRYAESKAAQQCAVDIAQQNGMSGEAAQLSLRLLCFETLSDSTGAARDDLRRKADGLKRDKAIAASPRLLIEACQMLADYCHKIGDAGTAEDEMQEALEIAIGCDDLQLRWRTYQSYAQSDRKAERAIHNAEEAVRLARQIGSPELLAQSLQLLISWRFSRGCSDDYVRAEAEWQDLEGVADADTLFNALVDRALVHAKQNQFERSLTALKEAGEIAPQRLTEALYASAAVLMRAGRDQQALQVAEDALSRIDQSLTHRRALVQRTNLHRLSAQLQAKLGNLEQAMIHAESTRALSTPWQPDWADLQRWLDLEGVAAVYIFVSENSGGCLIAQPQQEPKLVPLGLVEKQILDCMPSRNMIDALAWGRALTAGLAALGPTLASALKDVCSNNAVVYLFPETTLAGFPFSALTFDDGRRMVDCCALVFAPALRLVKEAAVRNRPRRALVAISAGEERGVAFRTQCQEIADLPYWVSARHITDATVQQFRAAAPEGDVIHITCHGDVAIQVEEGLSASEIVLGDSQRVTAKDVSTLSLKADLVFLNACRSGVFRTELYSETGGFWRAFLDAGSASLIATLGYVDPSAAFELARTFYRILFETRCSKVEALRLAQHQLSARNADPLKWASHILIGCHR